MKNFEENSSLGNTNYQKQANNSLFELLYIINCKQLLRPELQSAIVASNFVIILLMFLSIQEIGLLSPFLRFNSQLIILCLFCSILVIVMEIIIGILYCKQILLKLQLLLYRNIVFPIAFFSMIDHTPQILPRIVMYIISIACIILLILLELFIGKQSFVKSLIVQRGLPLSTYMLFFQVFLFIYSSQSQTCKKIAILMMLISSLAFKFGVIDSNIRRSKCSEYVLYRIQASTNLLYSIVLTFFQILSTTNSSKTQSAFIFPLICIIILAQVFSQYTDQMKPIKDTFFSNHQSIFKFLECVQYVVDDFIKINNTQSMDITSTCFVPLYYQHVVNCKNPDCSIIFSPQSFSSNLHYKNLSTSILKIIQDLFEGYIQKEDENIQLKFALLKFYQQTGSSKIKIMQVISDIQKESLSLGSKIKVYEIKRYISDVDVVQFFENMKIQNSFQLFNQNLSVLMKLLIQFWSQFLQQRVDFQKVVMITQKVTPALYSIESKVEQALSIQTFSTIKIMKIYSEYCRWILNDHSRSMMIKDYISLLTKKMSQIHQINSMTADMEIGLIAIELSSKRLGQIKIANNQAANIFNYSKQQFLKNNVNCIMPKLYANYHDNFLKAFMGNQHKKVNTDRRLILGKKKQGYLFQIYLQLQKSIVTSTQELIFIANIQLAKIQQACILIICDDKGTISDFNSTYMELFEKSHRKNRNRDQRIYQNIQELIPGIFQLVMSDTENDIKETYQCYDNPVFGILQIKYQISKISLQPNVDSGYLIKGHRVKQARQPIFRSLSLTKALDQLAQQKDLKGMKIQYCSKRNEFCFNERLDVFMSGDYQSQFTIPYMKVQELGKLFGQDYQSKQISQFDAQIKTIRYCKDHFQRVQEIQSFESDMSQEQKATINDRKVGIIKEKLQDQQNFVYKNSPQIFSFIFALVCVILLSIFYIKATNEKNNDFKMINQSIQNFQFRGKLAEYVVYFQAQQDPVYGVFFTQQKQKLKQQLIDRITEASLPQIQKQRAMKIVYLEQSLKTIKFENLIDDQTFWLNQQANMILKQSQMTIFKTIVGILILIKLITNFLMMRWHQSKLLNIFSLFLTLSESQIKSAHKKCVEFLRDSNEALNQMQQKIATYDDDIQESQQENPHIKIRKFKNIFVDKSFPNFLKLNISSLVLIMIFGSLIISTWRVQTHSQLQINAYQFVSAVSPEYSVRLMKEYSQKKGFTVRELKQNFMEKYQTIDYKLASLNSSSFNQNLAAQMFKNKCNSTNFTTPSFIKCQTIEKGVMIDGVSAAVNMMSIRLVNIHNQPAGSQVLSELNELAVLLYHMVQPVFNEILSDQSNQLLDQKETMRILIVVHFILLLIVCIIDAFYQSHYPLKDIANSISHSKSLIKLIQQSKKKVKNGYTQI